MANQLSGRSQSVLDAIVSGSSVTQAADASTPDNPPSLTEDPTQPDPSAVVDAGEARRDESTPQTAWEALLGADKGTSGDAGDTESGSEPDDLSSLDSSNETGDGPSSETSGQVEKVTVTDDRGRREIEVDFSDKDNLRKYVKMAHGARKWQAERDRARTRLQTVETDYKEVKGNWDAVEKAYERNGIQGLVDLIDGEGSYEKFEKGVLDRYELRRNATPVELELMDARERENQHRRDLERERREREEFQKSIENDRTQAETRALESKIHPAFQKYGFEGKLDDAVDEHMFNEMLWNTALKKLEPYEERGLDITGQMVDQAFRDTATAIRRRIRTQAEKKVKKTVAKKKQDATENVQTAIQSGYKNNDTTQEAQDLIKSGDLTSLLRGWKKYGKVFNRD